MGRKATALPMTFEEALFRLARTPKSAIDALSGARNGADTDKRTKASKRPPRSGHPKTA
jgi:hypothetical protein